MRSYQFGGINEAFYVLCHDLPRQGVWRPNPSNQARRTIEFEGPVQIAFTNPRNRHLLIPERKWQFALPYAESLWILLGWNDLDALPGRFFKSLYNFSDDGKTWRAAYGPRLRCYGYNGSVNREEAGATLWGTVDQLAFVLQMLIKDPNTRQALVTIADPIYDDFDAAGKLLKTKDIPCTRSLHFMKQPNSNKLDLYVHMRSNDLVWGFSAVNVFNFTFMLEYVASLVGLEVGVYYHQVDNFHVYEDFLPMTQEVVQNCDLDLAKEYDSFADSRGISSAEWAPRTLGHLDDVANRLYAVIETGTLDDVVKIPSPFYRDWALVLFWLKNHKNPDISPMIYTDIASAPALQYLFQGGKK